MSMVPLTILFNISMPQVAGFVVLVVCGMGDRLGSAYLNNVLWMSMLLCNGNFSGYRENILHSEWLLCLAPNFR